MISVIATQAARFRTFGWVQDPSNLRSLCDVVAVFDEDSEKHRELVLSSIPKLVSEEDGRSRLLEALSTRPVRIRYPDLVGTAFTPRSASRCNGILQAAVRGQGRDFIGDWPADNFLRWAHAFGFVRYHYGDDSFEITPAGLELTKARQDGGALCERERELLTEAALAYPPAVRILNLLARDGAHLTKFEIGQKLGFVGENGFTSLPQPVLIRSLAGTESPKEKNRMKTDWDGSSDKYARMIASWLTKLGLVEQVPKQVTVTAGGRTYTETIGQAYLITARGITMRNRALGKSRHRRIAKNVCFEMLATKGADREYLRARRAFLLKFLSESRSGLTIRELAEKLAEKGLSENAETVRDDLAGLCGIGLAVSEKNGRYLLTDKIADFVIPLPASLQKSSLSGMKDQIRARLTALPHEYLSLIDLAYDSEQNRLFEMKIIELFTEECGFSGRHLGGSNKPDGVISAADLSYGIIVDTKAYSKGYGLPLSQADEMERYVRENLTRDSRINPNEWWLAFDGAVPRFAFLFVSGHFTGTYGQRIERIIRSTGVPGAALAISKLLLYADTLKSGRISQQDFYRLVFPS